MVKDDWDKAVQSSRPSEHLAPLAYTIKDAVKITGMSRSRLYEELKAGHLIAKKMGRRTLIPHESIEAWLNNLDNYPTAAGALDAPKLTP